MKKFSDLKTDICFDCQLSEATSTNQTTQTPTIRRVVGSYDMSDLSKHHQVKYNKNAFNKFLNILIDADITVPWNTLSDPVLHLGMFGKYDDASVNELEKITVSLGMHDRYKSTNIFGSFNQRNDDLNIGYIGWLFKNSGTKQMFDQWPKPEKDYDQMIFARTLAHELRHRAFYIISNDQELLRYMPPELQVGGLWWGSWGDIRFYDPDKVRAGGVSAEHAMIYATDKTKVDPKDPFFDNDLMANYPPDYWRKLYKKVMSGVAAWGMRKLNRGKGTPVPRPTGSDVPPHIKLPDLTIDEVEARRKADEAAQRYIFPKMQTNPVYREMFNRHQMQSSSVGTKFNQKASPQQYKGMTHDAISYALVACTLITESMTNILWQISEDPKPAKCNGADKRDVLKNPSAFYNKVRNYRDKIYSEVAIKGNFYKLRELYIEAFKWINTMDHFDDHYVFIGRQGTAGTLFRVMSRNPCLQAIPSAVNIFLGHATAHPDDQLFMAGNPNIQRVALVDKWMTDRFRENGLQGPEQGKRGFSFTPETTQKTLEYFSYDKIAEYLRANPDYDPFDVKFGAGRTNVPGKYGSKSGRSFATTPKPTAQEREDALKSPPGTVSGKTVSPTSTRGQPSSVSYVGSSGRGQPATSAPTVTPRAVKKPNFTWLSRVKSRLNIRFGSKSNTEKPGSGGATPSTTTIPNQPLTSEEKSLVEKLRELIENIRRENPYLGDRALVAAAILAIVTGGFFAFRRYLFDRKTQYIASKILRDKNAKILVQDLRRKERRRVIELLKDPKFREKILAEL